MAGSSGIADAQYRDLYFYSLYRVLEAGLLALLLFGPIRELLPEPARPALGKITSIADRVAATSMQMPTTTCQRNARAPRVQYSSSADASR